MGAELRKTNGAFCKQGRKLPCLLKKCTRSSSFFFFPRYLLHYESKIRCCRQKAISPTQRANASGHPKGKAVDLQREGGGGPLIGCRLKFSYFVGSRLKFSIFVGSRLNFLIFVGCRKISVNK